MSLSLMGDAQFLTAIGEVGTPQAVLSFTDLLAVRNVLLGM